MSSLNPSKYEMIINWLFLDKTYLSEYVRQWTLQQKSKYTSTWMNEGIDEQYFEQMPGGHERASHAVWVVYTKNQYIAGAEF